MAKDYSVGNIHHEVVLEDHLVRRLVEGQGYIQRVQEDYDRRSALDKELIVRFLKETQPDEWTKLTDHYTGRAEEELFHRLERALQQRGTLDVLRNGLKLVPNIHFRLCALKPASDLNPELTRMYEANILSVIRQLRYSLHNENAIDVVLFVNGIPVVTMELKNRATGTNFRHAERQYRQDRRPAGEPLLTAGCGALVHFAADGDNVSMTTTLMNSKTRFLPFNRGRDGGAGNPDISGEFRIAYLYADQPEGKAIFSREVLLDLIGRFIYQENGNGRPRIIFPRYQQLDAVRKAIADARRRGPGHNYLIQHSAGSGKSLTIGWLAHQIINVHDDKDRPVFNTAIIITDRIVLDRQLQRTVAQLEQTPGVVRKIDGTSRQLREAIEAGARIIVTTIQKFSTKHLEEIHGQRGRTFAIIVDEAHSSQSGKSAQAMTEALTREAGSSEDVEDIILAYQRSRGPQPNMSFFAFTATPRNVTLERFGRPGPDGKPQPFHLYSMRQAIEEGFILDVLQHYMTYRTYYQLEKAIEDDPELGSRRGQRQVARYASLHEEAIGRKAEIIVEHFRDNVMQELDGGAKAMVVASSRAHALRYYLAIRDYLNVKGYDDMGVIVAFSGELEFEGQTWTEAALNGFSETELPRRFKATPELRFLVVAEKYQTGFDEPALCAMYVDRKLAGLQAVQTLSRLNRTHSRFPNKRTFVLDFQNTTDDIREAFKPYFEATELTDVTDPNQVYELYDRLLKFPVIDRGEVERFAETYFGAMAARGGSGEGVGNGAKAADGGGSLRRGTGVGSSRRGADAAVAGGLTSTDRIRLDGLIRQAVERFRAMGDEGEQEEFRQLLRSYMRFYSFIAQVIHLSDADLEKMYAYASWLSRLLPNRDVPEEIEITDDMLELYAFRVERVEAGEEGGVMTFPCAPATPPSSAPSAASAPTRTPKTKNVLCPKSSRPSMNATAPTSPKTTFCAWNKSMMNCWPTKIRWKCSATTRPTWPSTPSPKRSCRA